MEKVIPGHPWMQGFPITRPALGSRRERRGMNPCSSGSLLQNFVFVVLAENMFFQGEVLPGGARKHREGLGAARRGPGSPRRSSGMSASRGRKIGNLSLRVRLAASEGGKIVQIGSLDGKGNS